MSRVEDWFQSQLAGDGDGDLRAVTVRLPAATFQKLEHLAAAIRRSRSGCAEELLKQAVEEAWEVLQSGRQEGPWQHGRPVPDRSVAPGGEPTRAVPHPSVPNGSDAGYPLDQLAALGRKLSGAKPGKFVFPDGDQVSAPDWKDVTLSGIRWVGENLTLPVPFPVTPRSTRYLLNTSPVHPDGTRMEPEGQIHQLDAGGRHVYVDTKLPTDAHLNALVRLISEAGGDPSRFRVVLRVPPAAGYNVLKRSLEG